MSPISGRKEASYGKVHIGICEKGELLPITFVKDAVTGKSDTDCTRYLKHKVRQNRANNTIKRIAYILPFYMNFLSDKGLSLRAVSDLKFSEQSEHFSDFLMEVKKGAHTGSMKEVKNNTANSYLQAVFGLYDFYRDGTLPLPKSTG